MCLYHPALQCHWEACHLLTRTWTGRFGQFFFDITSQIPRWFSFCHGVRCRQIGRAAWPSREFGMPAIASHVPWFKKGTLQFGSSWSSWYRRWIWIMLVICVACDMEQHVASSTWQPCNPKIFGITTSGLVSMQMWLGQQVEACIFDPCF